MGTEADRRAHQVVRDARHHQIVLLVDFWLLPQEEIMRSAPGWFARSSAAPQVRDL